MGAVRGISPCPTCDCQCWDSIAFGRHSSAFRRHNWSSDLACAIQLSCACCCSSSAVCRSSKSIISRHCCGRDFSLLLAIALVQLTRPTLDNAGSTWALPLLLLLVPLAYEIDPHVPSFGWLPFGDMFALLVVALAFIASRLSNAVSRFATRLGTCISLTLLSGCLLVITVSRIPPHNRAPRHDL